MPKVCSVEGCEQKIKARGLCQHHYDQSRVIVKKCPQCGQTKKYYSGVRLCPACRYWNRTHNGEKRICPKIIRDGLKTSRPIEYKTFRGIHERCNNKKCPAYQNYGGRGIKVCDRWSGPYGFHNFYEDMGPRPCGKAIKGKPIYSLDRIDVNGDYCPENCRWADDWTQAANKQKKNRTSAINGVCYARSQKSWMAYLNIKNRHYIKYARSEEDAAMLRKELELKYLGHYV